MGVNFKAKPGEIVALLMNLIPRKGTETWVWLFM